MRLFQSAVPDLRGVPHVCCAYHDASDAAAVLQVREMRAANKIVAEAVRCERLTVFKATLVRQFRALLAYQAETVYAEHTPHGNLNSYAHVHGKRVVLELPGVRSTAACKI